MTPPPSIERHPATRPTGVGQIHISVTEVARSVEFYRDGLGLELLFEVPAQSMAFLQCGTTRLYLGVPEDPSFRSSPVLYLDVDDVDASYDDMVGRGVEFIGPPHAVHRTGTSELWMAFTRDPDGNAIAIMEERLGAA